MLYRFYESKIIPILIVPMVLLLFLHLSFGRMSHISWYDPKVLWVKLVETGPSPEQIYMIVAIIETSQPQILLLFEISYEFDNYKLLKEISIVQQQ